MLSKGEVRSGRGRGEGGVNFTYPKQVGCVVVEDGGRTGGVLSLGF